MEPPGEIDNKNLGVYRVGSPGLKPLPQGDAGADVVETLSGKKAKTGKKPFYRVRTFDSKEDYLYHVAYTGYRHIFLTTPLRTDDHPWFEHMSNKYMICANGSPGDNIQVDGGQKLAIHLAKSAVCNVMITLDPKGGKKAKPWSEDAVIKPGTSLIFTVKGDFPEICYYQSTQDQFTGGLIIWKDESDDDHQVSSGDEADATSEDE